MCLIQAGGQLGVPIEDAERFRSTVGELMLFDIFNHIIDHTTRLCFPVKSDVDSFAGTDTHCN